IAQDAGVESGALRAEEARRHRRRRRERTRLEISPAAVLVREPQVWTAGEDVANAARDLSRACARHSTGDAQRLRTDDAGELRRFGPIDLPALGHSARAPVVPLDRSRPRQIDVRP